MQFSRCRLEFFQQLEGITFQVLDFQFDYSTLFLAEPPRVEVSGLEPLTSALQRQRSTN